MFPGLSWSYSTASPGAIIPHLLGTAGCMTPQVAEPQKQAQECAQSFMYHSSKKELMLPSGHDKGAVELCLLRALAL